MDPVQGDRTATSKSGITDIQPLTPEVVDSLVAPTVVSVTAARAAYPKPPKLAPEALSFQCPCCCQSLPRSMTEPSRWRKHLAEDISPYTCILPDCPDDNALFTIKRDWIAHVLDKHQSTAEWLCSACPGTSTYTTEGAFVQHVRSQHKETVSDSLANHLRTTAKRQVPAQLDKCPICAWTPTDGNKTAPEPLLNHLAAEMHAFALSSLPWPDDEDYKLHDGLKSSEEIDRWLRTFEISLDSILSGTFFVDPDLHPVPPQQDFSSTTEVNMSAELKKELFDAYMASSSAAWEKETGPRRIPKPATGHYFGTHPYFAEDGTTTAQTDSSRPEIEQDTESTVTTGSDSSKAQTVRTHKDNEILNRLDRGTIALAEEALSLVIDATTYYIGDTVAAQHARKRIAARRRAEERYSFAELHTIFTELRSLLREVLKAPRDISIFSDIVGSQRFLQSLQDVERILIDSDAVRAFQFYDENLPPHPHLPLMNRLVLSCSTDGYGVASEHIESRVSLITNQIKLSKLSGKKVRLLVDAVTECTNFLRRFDFSVMLPRQPERPVQQVPVEVWKFFESAERLNHFMAFAAYPCPAEQHGSGCRWKRSKVAFLSVGLNDEMHSIIRYPGVQDGDFKIAYVIFDLASVNADSNLDGVHKSASECDFLLELREDQYVSISGGGMEFVDMPQYGLPPIYAPLMENIQSAGIFNFEDVLELKPEARLSLALILSYAYIGLGGGPWWPYERIERLQFITLPDRQRSWPLFAVTKPEDEMNEQRSTGRRVNSQMPSLPEFGKLLLELCTGRSVPWSGFDQAMIRYKDATEARVLLAAIKACLEFDKHTTIRKDDVLRERFKNKVVLELQWFLEVVYEMKAQDIFRFETWPG